MSHRSETEMWIPEGGIGSCVNYQCEAWKFCYSAACLYAENGFGQLGSTSGEFDVRQMRLITETRRRLGCPHADEVQKEIANFAADHGIPTPENIL